jgi:hypothetical protein
MVLPGFLKKTGAFLERLFEKGTRKISTSGCGVILLVAGLPFRQGFVIALRVASISGGKPMPCRCSA